MDINLKQRVFFEELLEKRNEFVKKQFRFPDYVFVNQFKLNEIFGDEQPPIKFYFLNIYGYVGEEIIFGFKE